MADINLTSTTGSGFLETDFDQLKGALQSGTYTLPVLLVTGNITSAGTVSTYWTDKANFVGALTVSTANINSAVPFVNALTATTAQLNTAGPYVAALTVTTANINAAVPFVNALTASTTELNYVDGVTSAIQTQLNAKAASGANTDITSIGSTSFTYLNAAIAPGSDHTGSGVTVTGTAGEDLAIGDVVYGKLSTTYKWFKVDADAEASSKGALGVVTETITSGNTGKILLYGVFRDDTYAWTVGATLYLSTTPGALTETAPSGSADIVRIAAYAITADVILFQPEAGYIELA